MSTAVAGNAEQVEYWNGPEGQHWADHEARFDAMLVPFLEPVLGAAAVGAGTASSTSAAATARSSRAAAARGATVTGVDISAPMLARARERATAEALAVEFVQADAQVHAFAEPFDAVVSRFGVMFFADPAAAFANLAGRAAPGGPPGLRLLAGPVRQRVGGRARPGHAPDRRGARHAPARRARTVRLRRCRPGRGILEGAGFSDVAVDAATQPLLLGGGLDLDEAVAWLAEGGMGKRFLGGADAGHHRPGAGGGPGGHGAERLTRRRPHGVGHLAGARHRLISPTVPARKRPVHAVRYQ